MRMLVVAAALALAGCVTPMNAADQTPAVQYLAPGRTLVAVVDERIRTEEGRPENFAGFARNYGIPINWTVETLMLGAREDKNKTMAELLSARLVSGLAAQGADARGIALQAPLNDAEARALLEREAAERLMTVQLKDWHFDLNINWVGRFQFNSDAVVTVQDSAGTVMTEQFAERAAIQAQGEESWPNMILTAYREKMEQILHDAEVRAAMTAPPRELEPEGAPTEEAVPAPMF